MDLDYTAHLERLRDALWCNRQTSRASVLVGAGFSRNARPRAPTSVSFPLWRDLGKAMVQDLGVDAQAISNPLRLASQYEAAFGRPALDDLLCRLVPDDQHEPGEAHRLLLFLPWADVFTTNYDTLLERTRPLIDTRRYEVVLSPEDLPHSARPRIVKLHGSMPSHRPFLATEEDFRRYPRDAAPFVNTVQQSAMETVLCLLGFGGDDPNFLQWAGWVRDNLGEHAPAIFLIGVFDLPESERALLASRRVTAVDLGPLFPRSRWHNPQVRHEKAVLWLLRSLHQGRPPDNRAWPQSPPISTWPDELGCPPLLQPRVLGNQPREPVPGAPRDRLTPDQALELVACWKAQRQAYPGWLVCPETNRQLLQAYLLPSAWSLDEILAAFLELPLPRRLIPLYELVWRLRVGLNPIFDECVKAAIETLERINPWPDRLDDLAGASVLTPASATDPAIDWHELESSWVYLAFALLRDARHCYDGVRFDRWKRRLEKISSLSVDWQHWVQYEYCEHLLAHFRHSALRLALEAWSALPLPLSPVWLGRRAALHAENDDLDAARRHAADALETTRTAQGPVVSSFALLSLEGWLVGLQGILVNASWMDAKKKRNEDPTHDSNERLLVLGGLYRCDPHLDLEARRSKLLSPIPPAHEMKPGFDPGVVHSSYHVRASPDGAPWALVLMMEEGCWPLRAGTCDVLGKQISIAALRLSGFVPEYALNLLIRSRSDGLEEWLTRAKVAMLEEKVVLSMYGVLDGAIRDALDSHELPGELAGCLEALSRLCFRLSSQQHQQVLDLAVRLFASPEASADRVLVQKVNGLYRRLLFSMAPPDLALAIPKLLSLQLKGPQRRMGFDYPDPFRHVDPYGLRLLQGRRQDEWQEPIAELLRRAKDGDAATRLNAWDRLSVLLEIGALTNEEAATMGHALWHRVDARGLPADVPFTMPYLLRLPAPTPELAQERVRAGFLERPFPPFHQGSDAREAFNFLASLLNCTRRPWFQPEVGRTRIDWSLDEARRLLSAAQSWWTEARPALERLLKRGDDSAKSARMAIQTLVLVLGDAIAMRLPASPNDECQVISGLISDIRSLEKSADVGIPHAQVRLGASLGDVERASKSSLHTFEFEEATTVANGVVAWQLWSQTGAVAAPGTEVLDQFILYSVLHRDSSLRAWLSAVTDLVRFAPQAITDTHLEALTFGLARLLEDTRLEAEGDGVLSLSDRPEARSEAAGLAWALQQWCTEHRKVNPPGIVDAWREACSIDPLPEVRRAWGP